MPFGPLPKNEKLFAKNAPTGQCRLNKKIDTCSGNIRQLSTISLNRRRAFPSRLTEIDGLSEKSDLCARKK
jgi:hypothetical protein